MGYNDVYHILSFSFRITDRLVHAPKVIRLNLIDMGSKLNIGLVLNELVYTCVFIRKRGNKKKGGKKKDAKKS